MSATDTPRIDVQAHYMPDVHRDGLAAYAAADPEFASLTRVVVGLDASAPLRRLDEERVAEMDAAGLATQVISLPPPGVLAGDVERSAELAGAANDALVAAAARFPGRFAVLASLPLPHVDASLATLEQAASRPLIRGVIADTTSTGWTLDAPEMEVIYARLSELGLPLFLHPPLEPLPPAFGDWGLSASIATMFSTTLTVLRLVFSGMLDRVPSLDVVIPHLGGTVPYLLQRLIDLNGQGGAEHELVYYLRNRFHYDSCSYHPPALRCAVDTVGAERIMLGSDYPFRGGLNRTVEDVANADLQTAERDAILDSAVAARWFGSFV